MNRCLLQVRDLGYAWGPHHVFDGLSFDVPFGVSWVTGDEQCGKSTLLRLLNGEIQPQSGEIRWLQSQQQTWRTDPMHAERDSISARQWWSRLAIDHTHPLKTDLAMDLAHGFGLDAHLDKPLFMLSAGTRRKVELTTAFAIQVPLTLIDNPFAALDAPSSRFLVELLREASAHSSRAWILADYEPPSDVQLARVWQLGSRA